MTQPSEPLTHRKPGRALTIAAIHAFAEHLAANPELPAPQHLIAWTHEFTTSPEAYEESVRYHAALWTRTDLPAGPAFAMEPLTINGVLVEQRAAVYPPAPVRAL